MISVIRSMASFFDPSSESPVFVGGSSMTIIEYDSEDEDQPREVADLLGDFTLMGANLTNTFKLHNFAPKIQTPDGSWVPFEGVMAIRPVPEPQAVAHAKTVMGNGK
jgi:hypothetical protein